MRQFFWIFLSFLFLFLPSRYAYPTLNKAENIKTTPKVISQSELEAVKKDKVSFLIIPIDNKIITPALANFFGRVFKKSSRYDGVIILIDTPGGFLSACEDIVKIILSSNVPTIAYVSPRGAKAGSAGVFIALACDFVAMAPNTRIGAAHPILAKKNEASDLAFAEENEKKEEEKGQDEKRTQKQILSEKVINDILAFFRSYVEEKRKDIDLELAEELITKSKSLTEKEALDAHIIDAICDDINEVIDLAAERGVIPRFKKKSLDYAQFSSMETLMYYITSPYLLYLLSSISVILLLFEFTHPGFGVPGIVGLLGIGICMYGYGMLPVNYLGLFLIVLGIIFCVMEAFTPGIGLLAISGVGSLLWGSLILWKAPGSMYVLPLSSVIPIIVVLVLFIFGIIALAVRIKRKKSVVGTEAMIGKVAEVIEPVDEESGKVFIMGEYWNARSSSGRIEKGRKAVVEKVDGLVLVVSERRQ